MSVASQEASAARMSHAGVGADAPPPTEPAMSVVTAPLGPSTRKRSPSSRTAVAAASVETAASGCSVRCAHAASIALRIASMSHLSDGVVDWFGCPDRRPHRAELGGLPPRVLGRRASVRINEVPMLDVGVAQLDQQARVLSLQESSGDSASPEVDALARVL